MARKLRARLLHALALVTLAAASAAAPAQAAPDLCPDTPRDAKPIVAGCAAVDIVGRPTTFSEPVADGLVRALGALHPSQYGAAGPVGKAYRRVAEAAVLMRRGKVCPAGSAYAEAVDLLRGAHADSVRALPALQDRARGTGPRVGDVSQGDLNAIALRLGPAALQRALSGARAVKPAFAGPCRMAGPPLDVEASVGRVDDAENLLRRPGRTLALTSDVDGQIFTGGRGRLRGLTFKDGTGLLTGASLEPQRVGGQRLVPRDSAPKRSCAELRIVSFARAAGKKRPILDLRGYQKDGKLWLEHRMELAADETCKTTTDQDGAVTTTTSYALRIALSYTGHLTGARTDTLSHDLGESDANVSLPADMSAKPATLTVTELVRTCKGHPELVVGKFGEKVVVEKQSEPCALAERDVPKRSYAVTVLSTGAYAAVTHSRTVFDLDTHAKGTCQTTTIDAMALHPALGGVTDAVFGAEAWGSTGVGANCTSTRPALRTIGEDQPFAVHLDDPASGSMTTATRLAQYGVRRRAGMIWPRVVGTRDGYPFAYAADVKAPPDRIDPLVRDRLGECPDGQDFWGAPVADTFHRAPFEPKAATWMVLQGNQDDPGNFDSNSMLVPGHHHPEDQRYEWDMVNDAAGDGTWDFDHPIRASRAGYVLLVDRDEEGNLRTGNHELTGKQLAGGKYKGLGNYVWLRHADGTLTTYNHLRHNTVPAGVVEGAWVRRGQVIGKTGNTGDSSGPHLHWGAFTVPFQFDPTSPYKGMVKVPSRVQDTNHPGGCWIPREGEFFNSNNTLIDVPPFYDEN